MDIEETSNEIEQQNAQQKMLAEAHKEKQERMGYSFQYLDIGSPGIFPNFKSKATQEKFYQWGIEDTNLQLARFRFNKSFVAIQADDYLRDLLNDKQVIRCFQPLNSLQPGTCTGVKYTAMNCNVLNMTFFDVFRDANVVYGDEGTIRQNYEEIHMGMNLGDRLRQILVWEDYDEFEQYDLIHSDKYQKEFIFKLFQHIAMGGSVCQYEQNIQEYLKIVKLLYKDLVSVAKDPDTQEIKSYSQVFRIDEIEGYDNKMLYSHKEYDHPQNCFYVCIDPINWHVNFFYNKWVSHW